jgi:hypothetical protein
MKEQKKHFERIKRLHFQNKGIEKYQQKIRNFHSEREGLWLFDSGITVC